MTVSALVLSLAGESVSAFSSEIAPKEITAALFRAEANRTRDNYVYPADNFRTKWLVGNSKENLTASVEWAERQIKALGKDTKNDYALKFMRHLQVVRNYVDCIIKVSKSNEVTVYHRDRVDITRPSHLSK